MTLVVEDMAESDVEKVARLRMAAFFAGSGRTLQEDITGLQGLLYAGGGLEVLLVARVDGEVAGSVLLVRHELEQQHEVGPWLAGLVVAPEAQGRGVGSALVRSLETEARLRGVSSLYLYTWEARRFYARLGWRAVDRFEDGDGPAMLMVRRLL